MTKTEYVDDFKNAEVRPLYKKDRRQKKSDYRPVNIQERCLYDQNMIVLNIGFGNINAAFPRESIL